MLDTKLILVEGIPGSGKSTTATKIKEYFDAGKIKSRLYLEADCCNPSDYAWISMIPESDYINLIKAYPEFAQVLEQYSEKDGVNVLVYYQRMKSISEEQFPQELLDLLSRYEPYDGKLSAGDFLKIHLDRYRKFSRKASKFDEITIFESSFLQNQVNELLGFHNMDKELIVMNLQELAHSYEELNPILIYLTQPDISATIRKVADERRSPDKGKYPDWIDQVAGYIEKSVYGKANNLHGYEGVVEYLQEEKRLSWKRLESSICGRSLSRTVTTTKKKA